MSTILPISNQMIVENKVVLSPTITYTSASIESKVFKELDVESSGVFGSVKPRLNNLNTNYRGISQDVTTTREYNTNATFLKSKLEETNILDYLNQNLDNVTKLKDSGLFPETSHKHEFVIEKIKEKFLIDDSNFSKKKTVLNLFDYYTKNTHIENHVNLNWGFGNYNTLNFFSVGDVYSDSNNGINNSLTHKNSLLYPNIKSVDNKQPYDFSKNQYTFSFYINPRYTNKSGYHFNPGCILSIPGLISIYLIKGVNRDENNSLSSYRLFFEAFSTTYNEFQDNFTLYDASSNPTGFDISDSNTQIKDNKLFLLKDDNTIQYNYWHNIIISMSFDDLTAYSLKVFVNGEEFEDFNIIEDQNYNFPDYNSFISIGNKPQIQNQGLIPTNFIDYAFSIDKEVQNDSLGPYVSKHILMGNTTGDIIDHPPTPVNIYNYRNNLEAIQSNYVTSNTSLALHAELHDLRIYNVKADFVKAKEIFKNSINDLENEILNGLIFYVPIYFYPQITKKDSIVNLNTDNSKILKEKIANNSINNLVFENTSGGFELLSEAFLREFVDHSQPNIVIGGNVNQDITENIFNFQNLNSLQSSTINSLIKKGFSPNQIADQIMFNLNNLDNTQASNNNLGDNFYQLNHVVYRNNMILPNDNGYQKQYFHDSLYNNLEDNIKNKYFKNKISKQLSYDVVYLRQNFDLDLNKDSDPKSLYTSQSNQNTLLNTTAFQEGIDNVTFEFESGKKLNSALDKLYDISRSNFYTSSFDYTNINDALKYNQTDSLSIDQNSFYRTYSNPSSRRIGASFSGIVSNSLYTTKNLKRNDELISYKKFNLPLYKSRREELEYFSSIYSISTQIFNKKIKCGTLCIYDYNLGGTLGAIKLSFKDNEFSGIYRSDCKSPHATWNKIGNFLSLEGLATFLHPGIENFGRNNFKFEFESYSELLVHELNLPINASDVNTSRNKSYLKNLKLDNSSFNSDEGFVYISDINLHDENLNIIAKARLTQPFPKKDSDNLLIRLKMDY